MRQLRIAIAFLCVSSLFVFAPTASAATASAGPRLIAGTLRNEAGSPSTGRVLVFHDNLRDADRLEFVGYAKANGSGRFKFQLGHVAKVDQARSHNDGFANFAMYGVTPNGVSRMSFFSARLDKGAASWKSEQTDLDGAKVSASEAQPTKDFAEKIATLIDGQTTPTSNGGIVPLAVTGDGWLDYCLYNRIQTWDAATPVMELHTYYTGQHGTARYARASSADSDIGVGVKYGSTWSLEGTTHVGNSDEVSVSKSASGRFGWSLTSSFRYSRWQFSSNNNPIACAVPPAPMYVVESVRWNGTSLATYGDLSSYDGKCATAYASHNDPMTGNDTFSRVSKRLITFTWGLNVSTGLTINMAETSGASSNVTFDYWTGTDRSTYNLCGSDDFPAYAHRIFAG